MLCFLCDGKFLAVNMILKYMLVLSDVEMNCRNPCMILDAIPWIWMSVCQERNSALQCVSMGKLEKIGFAIPFSQDACNVSAHCCMHADRMSVYPFGQLSLMQTGM